MNLTKPNDPPDGQPIGMIGGRYRIGIGAIAGGVSEPGAVATG